MPHVSHFISTGHYVHWAAAGVTRFAICYYPRLRNYNNDNNKECGTRLGHMGEGKRHHESRLFVKYLLTRRGWNVCLLLPVHSL